MVTNLLRNDFFWSISKALVSLIPLLIFIIFPHLTLTINLPSVWNEDPRKTHKEGFNPPTELLDHLKVMTEDPHTSVYLLSGRGKADLNKIGSAVPKLGLLYVFVSSFVAFKDLTLIHSVL